MLSSSYSMQTFEVTSIRPKGASKLAVLDGRMAELRRSIRKVTEGLKRASEEGKAA